MYNSNQSGLRIAEEATPKVLPGSPVWNPAEPNSYGDFGGDVKTEARMPIAADRQRRKGPVVDLDAAANFQTDFTTKSFEPVMQGFMYADWRDKPALDATAVTGTGYTVAASGTDFAAGSLIFAYGFATASNNGFKGAATASTGTSVTVAGTSVSAETGSIVEVGVEAGTGELAITEASGVFTLESSGLDLSTLGLIPGEWVWLGGDDTANRFTSEASNNGFWRVLTITASAIVFDRVPAGAAADAGTGKDIQVFYGSVVKNEADPDLQVERTYQVERAISSSVVEYVTGCLANELKLTTKTSSKLVADMGFVGLDHETAGAKKAGDRPAVAEQSAYNASSNYRRLRVQSNVDNAELAVFLTDLELTVNNGAETDKAIGSLGGVGFSIGDFMVSASIEGYFTSLDAVDAVRSNETCSLDFATVTNAKADDGNQVAVGWLFDLPSLTMSDARLKVEKDKKVKLPLTGEAFASEDFNHTLLVSYFRFLPQLAV